jgi:hypothetical protein
MVRGNSTSFWYYLGGADHDKHIADKLAFQHIGQMRRFIPHDDGDTIEPTY